MREDKMCLYDEECDLVLSLDVDYSSIKVEPSILLKIIDRSISNGTYK